MAASSDPGPLVARPDANARTVGTDKTVGSVRPVLKWAGGKGRLLPELLGRAPDSFNAYHEPFLGGGAMFFALASSGRAGQVYLSDANPSLIEVYRALRDDVAGVIAALRRHVYEREH